METILFFVGLAVAIACLVKKTRRGGPEWEEQQRAARERAAAHAEAVRTERVRMRMRERTENNPYHL